MHAIRRILMKPIRRILVAVKDTELRTWPALEKAAQLAQALGASVDLYHAISEPVYFDSGIAGDSLEELRASRRDLHLGRLQLTALRLLERGVKTIATVDWDYPPAEAIVRRATLTKADLIVADCHEGPRFTRWLMHLTDWDLLRASPVPVLLVKRRELYEKPIALAAVDPTHAHAKPALLDDAILRYGKVITQALSGSLHTLHANFPISLDVAASEILDDRQVDILRTRSEERARIAFGRLVRKARIPRAMQHLVTANPALAIPEMAKETGADLVVMGAVSRSGLKRLFIGNTAERVLRKLECDVLVVKPQILRLRMVRKSRGSRLTSPLRARRAKAAVLNFAVIAAATFMCMPGMAASSTVTAAREEFLQAAKLTPSAERGARHFETCSACHGASGQGASDGSVPAIAGQHGSVLLKQLVDFRHDQRWDERMQHFTDRHHLPTAQDLTDVAAFVAKLPRFPAMADTIGDGTFLSEGASVYFRVCEACHGPLGQGDVLRLRPRLAGQHYEYLLRQLGETAAGYRPGMDPAHVERLRKLSPEQIRGVADYLSRVSPDLSAQSQRQTTSSPLHQAKP